MGHTLRTWACAAALSAVAVGCIDEDLSDCGHDYEVNYTLRLETTLDVHVDQELTTQLERELGTRLKAALAGVFDEHAHDVSLLFYGEDSTCVHAEYNEPNASTASFSIYLPINEYMHLAVANSGVAQNNVDISERTWAPHAHLHSVKTDTMPSHTTGIFSTRMPMHVQDYDQAFHAHLYMQNCATVLVIDPKEMEIAHVEAVALGMAHEFALRDSLYRYPTNDIPVRAVRMDDTGSRLMCLYTVSFPSRDEAPDSRAGEDVTAAIWHYKVSVTLPDGKMTESTLHFNEPIKAGGLKIVKASLNDQGAIVPNDPEVGVSVELDWNQGGVFNPEL